MSTEPHETTLLGPDDPLARQLRDVARQLDNVSQGLDSAPSSFDGSAIRDASNALRSTTPAQARHRFRSPGRRVALSVAACIAFVLGGFGLVLAMQNEQPVQPVSALDGEPESDADAGADADSAALSEGETAAPSQTTTEPRRTPPVEDVIPRAATADDVGPAMARLLPPTDADYQLIAAAQILHSEAELGPLPPSPQIPGPSAFYTDDEGNGSLRLHLATYGTASDADLAVDFAESNHYLQTEVIDEGGLTGVWIGDELGFAPYVGSATDQSVIGTAEIRIDDTRILTVLGIDLSRELALSLALQVIAADGDGVFPPAPEGYTGPTIMAGPAFPTFRPDTDQLILTLSERGTGELVELMIQPADPDTSTETGETADVIGTTGMGWYDVGLWGEVHVTWVRPEVTVELINPTGNLSFQQLVDLAESLESLDEGLWVERTAGVTLVRTPVHS